MDWKKENSYLESDFERASKQGAIKQLDVYESPDGYYITISVSWSPVPFFLATRRDRSKPRRFRDANTLLMHIRNQALNIPIIEIHIDSLPPKKRAINRQYSNVGGLQKINRS